MEKTAEGILQDLIGHRVRIQVMGRDHELREQTGILRGVTKDMIHLTVFGDYGEGFSYYLNRHATVLFSVVDEGLEDGSEK